MLVSREKKFKLVELKCDHFRFTVVCVVAVVMIVADRPWDEWATVRSKVDLVGVKPLIFDLRLIIKKLLAIVFWIKMPYLHKVTFLIIQHGFG